MSSSDATQYYEWIANILKTMIDASTKYTMGTELFLEKLKELEQAINNRSIILIFRPGDVGYIIKDKNLIYDPLFTRILTEVLFVLKLYLNNQRDDIVFAQYKLLVSTAYLDNISDKELEQRFQAIKKVFETLKLNEQYLFQTETPFDKLVDIEINTITIKETNTDAYALTLHTLDQNGNYKKQTLILNRETLDHILKTLMNFIK